MKAIMYHYVRPHDPELPALKHLHLDDFRKQLEYFQETYGIIGKDQFIRCITNGETVEGVVLTFDDGLKCHFDYVLPELKKRGLWGIFYVPTGMYGTQKILDVHRIHILLAMNDATLIHEELMNLVSDSMLPDYKRREFHQYTYTHQIDSNSAHTIKRILNYFISYSAREQLIDELMKKFVPEHLQSIEKILPDNFANKGNERTGHDIGKSFCISPGFFKVGRAESI